MGLESFWRLPVYPRTPYYRTYETSVHADAHLYEFVVPMVPPSWNERDRVTAYAAELTCAARPTAVAVSILDVCTPAIEQGTDHYTHWALTHFLLDGDHKMQAASETGRPVRLLSLLAVDAGLAAPEQVAQLPMLRGRRRRSSTTADPPRSPAAATAASCSPACVSAGASCASNDPRCRYTGYPSSPTSRRRGGHNRCGRTRWPECGARH